MSEIQQGLLITAIGMGLVFAVIIFLWGLMALMLRVTSRREEAAEQVVSPLARDDVLVPEMQMAEGQRRAAAAATAVGLAIAAAKSGGLKKPERDQPGGLSPWQAVHRTRALEQHKTRG